MKSKEKREVKSYAWSAKLGCKCQELAKAIDDFYVEKQQKEYWRDLYQKAFEYEYKYNDLKREHKALKANLRRFCVVYVALCLSFGTCLLGYALLKHFGFM